MLKGNYKEKERVESESITFRIEKNILEELREDSKHKVESLNTLTNQILKSYINWHKPASTAGQIYISKELFVRLLDNLTDEQIAKIAEDYVKCSLKGYMYMLRREHDLSCFIDGLCTWLEVSGFGYRHDNSNNVETYKIRFDLGRKWSIFFGKYLQYAFEDLKVKNVEFEITDNMVMFRIKK